MNGHTHTPTTTRTEVGGDFSMNLSRLMESLNSGLYILKQVLWVITDAPLQKKLQQENFSDPSFPAELYEDFVS